MLALQLRDLPLDQGKPLGLALELGAQACRQAEGRELLLPTVPADALYTHIVHNEQIFDSRDVSPALADQALTFTMRPPGVFFGLARHAQHRPNLFLPRRKAREVYQQLAAVDAL